MRNNYQKQLKTTAILTFTLLVMLFPVSMLKAQIATTTAAARCGAGIVTLRATGAGIIKWYDVPFYGTPIASGVVASEGGSTFTTPWLEVTKTYYADALDASDCSINTGKARIPVVATISASAMQASIYYSNATFCKTISGLQPITLTGTVGGTFVIDPVEGLNFNNTLGSEDRGSILPSNSTVGTYTVTYTAPATEGCTESPAVTTVSIATAPAAPAFNYPDGTTIGANTYKTYCSSNDPVAVNWTSVSEGGSFFASPTGLTLASNGTFTPASSSSGVYAVTYSVPGGGGCAPQTASVTIAILRLPTAAISYGSANYTKNQGTQSVSLTGTGAYTDGGFTASAGGLTIDATTGTITPGSSTAGNYTITYTLAAVSPCVAATPATTAVTIYPLPTASISGSQSVCQNSAAPEITFTGANGTAPYTFSYKIGDGDPQTVVTTSGNSVAVAQPTVVTGAYVYTLLSVSDDHSSSQSQTDTETITVSTAPLAAFTYPNSPYCTGGTGDPLPTMLEGSVKGNFTVPEADVEKLIFISASTGQIDLSACTAGTYTVTNTISGSGGCSTVTSTAFVTITKLPVATFSYAGSPYCQDVSDPSPTYSGDGVAGLFSATPVGLTFVDVNTGQVDLSNSATGTYTVTNTISASSGCAEVPATSSITINSAVLVGTPVFLAGETSSRCGAEETVPYDATATNSTSIIYSLDATSAAHSGNSINATTGAVTYAANWSGTTTITATATAYCGNTTTATHVVTTSPAVTVVTPVFTRGGTSTRCQAAGTETYTATATNSTSRYYSMDEASRTAGNSIDPSTGVVTYVSGWSGTSTITATGTAECSNTATANHVVTINPLPTASAGGTQTICSNSTATVSGAAAANGTISWAEDGAGSITSGGTTLTPTYTAATGDAGQTVTLTMTVTSNHASCSSATATATYTVNVNPLPTATAGGNQTICSTGTATVSGASAGNGTIVWTTSNGGGTFTNGTTATPTYAAVSADAGKAIVLTMTVSSTIACSTPITAVATYTVNVGPDAAITLTSAGGTNAQTLVLNTGLTNITYSITGGGTGAGVTGLPAGVGAAFVSGVLTISGTPAVANDYTYTVTTTGTCAQTTATGTIKVNAASASLEVSQTICSGSLPQNLTLAGTIVGSIIRWERAPNATFVDGTFTTITSGAETVVSNPLLGSVIGALSSDTWFRAVVQSGSCPVAYSSIIKVAVNPLPGPTFTDQPGAISIISTDVTYTTESGKASYAWTYSGSTPTDYTITSGGGNTNSVTLKWITEGDHTVSVNYSNSTGCAAAAAASSLTNVGGSAPAIGAAYGGGKVAYILQSGNPGYVAGETHGLIAATADISVEATTTFPWWNGTATTTGATATALGTGSANTTTIIGSAGNTGSYAAKLCRDYTDGTYHDWYLPSKDELNKLYLNKGDLGVFQDYDYWSSTEVSSTNAYAGYFSGTYTLQDLLKSALRNVRAIRSF